MSRHRAKTQEQSIGETAVVSWRDAEGPDDRAALLEALARDAPFGLCFLAWPDFRFEYANAALAEIAGTTVEAMLGRTRAEIIGAEAARKPDALCHQALASGQPVMGAEMRLRLARQPDDERQFQISYLPVYDGNGQPRGVWSLVQETTHRHRQQEEMLRVRQEAEQASARLRALFDAVEDPILMADVNGRLVETNAAGHRYLNSGSERESLPTLAEYLASHRMFNAEGLLIPEAMRPIVRALAGEIVQGLEVRVLPPEGEPMWALVNAAPVRSAEGRILGSVLMLHDVTHRHEAREQLEQAYQQAETERQLLAHIFDNIPFTHVALFNQDGQLVRINPDGPRLMGYETADQFRAALAKPDAWKVLRADGTPVTPNEWPLARALRGERFDSEEYYVLSPDGYEARFLMNGGPVAWDKGGRVTLAVNVGHDVRELRRLMDEAERERARYRTLTETIPQFVWSADPDGRRTYFNAHWEAFTGTPTAQLLGDGWLQDIHPHDRERVAQTWAAACKAGGSYEAEYRLRGKDGTYRYFLARGTGVYDSKGRLIQIVGTTTDITDQVRERNRNRLLRQVGDSLRSSDGPNEVMRACIEILGRFLQAARVFYAILSPEGNELTVLNEYRRDAASRPVAGVYPLPEGNAPLQVVMAGQHIRVTDVLTDPLTRARADQYRAHQVRSLLAVPIIEGARCLSMLIVTDDTPREWTDEELELVEAVVERTRLAVENARLHQAERQKTQRLMEAFAETHHRVKNNLQVIAALLDMRVMDDGDDAPPVTRDDLRRMVGQVRAIAAVHDFLSHHQSAMTVSARELIKRLVPMAMQTAGVKATWQADEVVVSVQQGTALALILQELLSNAGKHGARTARVLLQCGGAGCLLEVADDGPGFPPDFDVEREAHQGLALIVALAERDLQGNILFETGESGGGCVRIRFRVLDE